MREVLGKDPPRSFPLWTAGPTEWDTLGDTPVLGPQQVSAPRDKAEARTSLVLPGHQTPAQPPQQRRPLGTGQGEDMGRQLQKLQSVKI